MSLNNLNAVIVERSWKPVSSELKHHKKTIIHTIKIVVNYNYVTINVQASVFFYQIVESNRIEKSTFQRDSNRIESNFPLNRNAVTQSKQMRGFG